MMHRHLAICAGALALAGCVSGDPRQGGFVSGVVGIAGGGYQARIDARERELATLLDHQQRLSGRISGQRATVAALDARIALTERRIAALRARAAAGGDLDALRRQIADLQRLRDDHVEQRAEAVRRARRELETGAGGSVGGSPLPPGRV